MSYADAAAKGPQQSEEEKRAPLLPEIAHDDTDVHSIDSSSSDQLRAVGGVNKQPSYADQQLAEEQAEKARKTAHQKAEEVSAAAQDFKARADKDAHRLSKEASDKAKGLEKDAEKKFDQFKDAAGKEYSKAKKELSKGAEEAKKDARKAEQWAEKNKSNPVVVGNAVVITALAGILGVGAYRLHKANALTWKVAGAWAGAVGLFAVGDYFVSQ